jgi:hypothetical protein
MQDVTIILQGRVGSEQMELWKKHYKNWNVVVSTWEDVDFDFNGGIFSKWLPKKWKLVINKYPLVRFKKHANLDYQIITTLSGLNEVKTKWVIKARCDEYWSNLDVFVKKMKEESEKITTSSMYFRKWGMYRFHISDKIIGGTLDNLLLMFESTLHNLEINFYNTLVPESQLGLGFIVGKEKELNLDKLKNRINLDLAQIHPIDTKTLKKELSKAIENILNTSTKVLANNFQQDSLDLSEILKKFEHINDLSNYCITKIKSNQHEPVDDKELLRKWFQIVNIDELKPYISTRSNGGPNYSRIYYRDDFDHEKETSLTDINQD